MLVNWQVENEPTRSSTGIYMSLQLHHLYNFAVQHQLDNRELMQQVMYHIYHIPYCWFEITSGVVVFPNVLQVSNTGAIHIVHV